jgi:DNA repair protein RadC
VASRAPVDDTGRVFDTVATPVPPQGVNAISLRDICSAKLTISTSVLILHNHPSGDPVPSPEDMALTRRLAAAGVLMGIDVIDHVVLGDVRYWSFKEAGRL